MKVERAISGWQGRCRVALVLAGMVWARAGMGQGAAEGGPSYFEFGTVVALGQRSVEVQVLDPERKAPVRRSFVLTHETRADLVHVGDSVEVIYAPAGEELELKRLLVFYAGLPQAGPAGGGTMASVPAPAPMQAARSTVVATVTPAPVVTSAPHGSAAGGGGGKSRKADAKAKAAAVRAAALPVPPPTRVVKGGTPAAAVPVNLGMKAVATTGTAVEVPLGAPREIKPAVPKTVAFNAPSAECNRGDADWPGQPLRIAVLDFRYPTEREEAHDAGLPGGGAGTAVADLVFQRLEQQGEFAVQRADRRRLDRTDIAGAARIGRQLGVDAVLAGTFAPVAQTLGPDGYPTGPQEYGLRAGLVDTCTGQLLLKLTSERCDAGGTGCSGGVVTAKAAAQPESYAQALRAPIETLLYPLEHNGGFGGGSGSVPPGVVTAVNGDTVTAKVGGVRVGEQVIVRASRLAKNPSTYTLNALQSEEIGRVNVRSVQGETVTGVFAGDVRPKVGDAAGVVDGR